MTEPTRTHFTLADADLDALRGATVSILGYGNQGHAHALNLKDSGVDVVVGLRASSARVATAEAAGLKVLDVDEATRAGDVVMVLLPDETHGPVYRDVLADNLKRDAILAFGHGFAIAFDLVDLPAHQRAMLVAPKGQGHKLREAFVGGGGLPSLLAVAGPAQEDTLKIALAYAKGCGALAGGGTLTSFREEAVTDQFGEQAVLCGGLVELITAAWETLVERGYSREVAYFECLHEVKLIVDLLHAQGMDGMREKISTTAAYGGLKAGPRVIDASSRSAMRALLDEIEDGTFARAFLDEQGSGSPWMARAKREEREHDMQTTGRSLRVFLQSCRLGDGSGESQDP